MTRTEKLLFILAQGRPADPEQQSPHPELLTRRATPSPVYYSRDPHDADGVSPGWFY